MGFRNDTAGKRMAASYRRQFREYDPLRTVTRSRLLALRKYGGVWNHFRQDRLECGHVVEVGWGRSTKPVKKRRCDACGLAERGGRRRG